jgi:hypothetical protein
MFIKTRFIVILAAAVILVMIAEWKYVSFATQIATEFEIENHTVRYYHGLCNGGVGKPYADFIHRLRTLYESGDTNALARVLRGADERSRDIYNVWLSNNPDAYQKSIHEILK